jgi:hypothetical protein
MTLGIKDTQHNNTLRRVPLYCVSRFIYGYAEYLYGEFYYAECRYAECLDAIVGILIPCMILC